MVRAAGLAVVAVLVVGVAARTVVLAVVFTEALAVVLALLVVAVPAPEVVLAAVVAGEVLAGDVAAAVAVVGSMALMAMPVPSAVATPILSEAASARPRGAAWGRRLRRVGMRGDWWFWGEVMR